MKMNSSQKIMMQDFSKRFFQLMEEYWNPESNDLYWDNLTDDATALISEFQTKDANLTDYLATLVVSFLNSREKQ